MHDMANKLQRNLNSLSVLLKAQQAHNESIGKLDPRIDSVLAYLSSDSCSMGLGWPRVIHDVLCETCEDWPAYYAGPMAQALCELAEGRKPSRDTLASLRRRMARYAA
jgi:hypothetical protein